ncbi:hypothetical protein H9P43_001639 [Blastocladiella emersonii ATCC 22665]|nr:hypothetical protein H9P43_001639 [Blastocladiella emersonii ATCC 22665]
MASLPSESKPTQSAGASDSELASEPVPLRPRPRAPSFSRPTSGQQSTGDLEPDLLWQASSDIAPPPVVFNPGVLQSDEPTLPNVGKTRPVDPDLDYLFPDQTTAENRDDQVSLVPPGQDPLAQFSTVDSPATATSPHGPVPIVPRSALDPRRPSAGVPERLLHEPRRTSSVTSITPAPLVAAGTHSRRASSSSPHALQHEPLRALAQELATTEFCDVSLNENGSPQPTMDPSATTSPRSAASPVPSSMPPPPAIPTLPPPPKAAAYPGYASTTSPTAPLPPYVPRIMQTAPLSKSDSVSSAGAPTMAEQALGTAEVVTKGAGGAPGPGKPDSAAAPVEWTDLPLSRKWAVFVYVLFLGLEVTDLLLGFVYLATYHFGCYALVTPFEGGLDLAYSMFYTALLATVAGAVFFNVHLTDVSRGFRRFPGNPLGAVLWLSDTEWEAWSNGDINRCKVLGLGQLLLRDSLMMLVVLVNLGPHDANPLTIVKLVLSSFSLARMGTHLFMAFATRILLCGRSPKAHQHTVFLGLKVVLTAVATAMWLVVPLAYLASPEMARYMYVADSRVTTARVQVLCVPPSAAANAAAGGNPAKIPGFCNPGACLHHRGTVRNLTAFDLEQRNWTTVPLGYVCASKEVPVVNRGDDERTFSVAIPGLPVASRFHPLLPCQPPIDGNGTRVAADAVWPRHLFMPYYTKRWPGRAFRHNLTATNPWVYREDLAEYFPPPQLVHQYAAGDAVAPLNTCVRRWVATTNFYGYLDLVTAGLLTPEEVNVRYQTYTVAVELTQRDRVTGPLACSFDYVGAMQRSVATLGGRDRLVAMGRDVARLLSSWHGTVQSP